MTRTPSAAWMTPERERHLTAEIARERPRLRNFIRSRVADASDVEDILQDVFAELERRERVYREGRAPPPLAGRTVVLVDDGLATGATMVAAVRAVRAARPLVQSKDSV